MVSYATDGRGGGNAMPSYLQGRNPQKPMITPKPSVAPGEVRPFTPPRPQAGGIQSVLSAFRGKPGVSPMQKVKQAITPKTPMPGAAPQAPVPQTLYDFFKKDLEAQRKSAMASSISDASNRGVYYGTPLTTSQGDIQTEYLRGLGQLQANVLQNEQQNQIQRLGLAGNLLNSSPQPNAGGIDPALFSILGQLFGGGQAAQSPITPKPMTPQEKGGR